MGQKFRGTVGQVVYKFSRKDIVNFYAIFDGGVSQWLTLRRDTLKISK